MEAAQEAASAVNTASSASNASASSLAELKAAAEKTMAAVIAAIDAFAEAAAVGVTTVEEAESATLGAAQACAEAVTAAEHLGSPDPINHTKQAEYEVQTALGNVSAAKAATHTLQSVIENLKTELTAPLAHAASTVEDDAAGPMQTAAGAMGNASTHLQAIT